MGGSPPRAAGFDIVAVAYRGWVWGHSVGNKSVLLGQFTGLVRIDEVFILERAIRLNRQADEEVKWCREKEVSL